MVNLGNFTRHKTKANIFRGANSLPNVTSIVMHIFTAGKRLNDKNNGNYVKTQRQLSKEILDVIQNFTK